MTDGNVAYEMTPLQHFGSGVRIFFARLRNRLPHLVWRGDEIDVRVVFTADKLPHIEGESIEDALREAQRELDSSPLVEMEQALSRLGVSFDKGMGPDGRDWEWDFSLRGPISVQFKRRAAKPERRVGRKRNA